MNKTQKAVWITGATSGIGKSLVAEFTKNSVTAIASARRTELLQQLKTEYSESVAGIEVFPLDVSNVASVKELADNLFTSFDVDCVINNAGITSFTSAEEDTMETVNKIIQTNLIGAVAVIKSVLPYFKKRGGGTIINILSVAANTVFKNSSAYSASKAGLLAYANVLREEVREDKIRVINILPGATATPIWNDELLEKFAGKMMSPEDVAKFVYKTYSVESNLVPEEIVLRPVTGDL